LWGGEGEVLTVRTGDKGIVNRPNREKSGGTNSGGEATGPGEKG